MMSWGLVIKDLNLTVNRVWWLILAVKMKCNHHKSSKLVAWNVSYFSVFQDVRCTHGYRGSSWRARLNAAQTTCVLVKSWPEVQGINSHVKSGCHYCVHVSLQDMGILTSSVVSSQDATWVQEEVIVGRASRPRGLTWITKTSSRLFDKLINESDRQIFLG